MSWAEEMEQKYMADLKKAKELRRKYVAEAREAQRLKDEHALETALAVRMQQTVDFVKACQVLRIPGDETTIYDYVLQKMQENKDI